jgi:trimeric autotransporter adhesin
MRILSSAGAGFAGLGVLLALASSGATNASPRGMSGGPANRAYPAAARRVMPQRHTNVATPGPCSSNYPTAGQYFLGITVESDVAGGNSSAVAGGYGNEACDARTGILAGSQNTIGTGSDASDGTNSSIGGGEGNHITEESAFIGAGQSNSASSADSFIGAGDTNVAEGNETFVGAGQGNGAEGYASFVGAGLDNVGTGAGSFLGAGDFTYYIKSEGSANPGNQVSGTDSFLGAGDQNTISGNGSFIGAGDYTYESGKPSGPGNQIPGTDSFIGAGDQNVVSANDAFLGSGQSNFIEEGATYGVIAGGISNDISGSYAAVAGGAKNVISGEYGAILGGYGNNATGPYGIVIGGNGNTAAGTLSFAAGYHAEAAHNGSFVWSDYSSGSALIKDAAANQFVARASGGIYLYSNEAASSGVALTPGSGTWANLSDRNAKVDIAPLDEDSILAKVATLPVSTWRYKTESGVRHLGPMAQDFYAAFGVGTDDRHITSIDEDGVALAAIKALHRENLQVRADAERKDAELATQRVEIVALRHGLQRLEAEFVAERDGASRSHMSVGQRSR